MLEKVKRTILSENLINEGERILVALSGGCDSVCLCLALQALGFEIAAAHLNHSIRKEADSDEAFVKEFAQKHNIQLHVKKADVPLIAKQERISLESAGRNERYKFFQEICMQYGYTKIAVAHNKNDNAETFLMNLMRGSGIKGLCSIPVKRDNIIRPLINVSRAEIEAFVAECVEMYVTDKTNFSNDYTRNKIRNVIIPEFLEISNNFIDSIYKTSTLLKDDYNYICSVAEPLVRYNEHSATITRDELIKYPASVISVALMKAYEYVAGTGKDFEKKHIDYIIENLKSVNHGNIMDLCFGVRCSLRYGEIVFEKQPDDVEYEYTLKAGESVFVKEAGVVFTFEEVSDLNSICYSKNCQYFAFEEDEIKIRSRKNGDIIVPFGSDSPKKVKKILIDKKIDVVQRGKLPVIEYNKDVIWLYGVCRSSFYKIDATTHKIYKIQGEKSNGNE
ncbi:MAG: tRNA lysidine(34) synthetase TilS [Clostridia bacterium]|nr:tRNA lysidine(34) synthetase TilS [Clostridia bacterium]